MSHKPAEGIRIGVGSENSPAHESLSHLTRIFSIFVTTEPAKVVTAPSIETPAENSRHRRLRPVPSASPQYRTPIPMTSPVTAPQTHGEVNREIGIRPNGKNDIRTTASTITKIKIPAFSG